jgi:uncharacterized membrane protein
MFPHSWIFFGVLHCIALSVVIARPLAGSPRLAAAIGTAVIAAGLAFSHPAFDTPWAAWIGFTTTKPVTEDYVPLFPWLGVVLVGIGAGAALGRIGFAPLRGLARMPRALHWIGRHSLLVYMAHQPVLIGLLALVAALRR